VSDGTSGTPFTVGPAGIFRPGTGGTFTYGTASYNVAGPVILAAANTAPVAFTLTSTGELTINAALTLSINNNVTGAPGAGIIIGTGSIVLGTYTSNYYQADTTQITATPINTGNFEWDAEAGGTLVPGWKRDT
jgi:hypothetical protein